MSLDEVIRVFIEYKGCRQGLFTDYGSVFDQYLILYKKELKSCSLFETADKENTLAIRYKNAQYVIYSTDERAAVWGIEYRTEKCEEAAAKYLELLHLTYLYMD